jgi:hypothetical protein
MLSGCALQTLTRVQVSVGEHEVHLNILAIPHSLLCYF